MCKERYCKIIEMYGFLWVVPSDGWRACCSGGVGWGLIILQATCGIPPLSHGRAVQGATAGLVKASYGPTAPETQQMFRPRISASLLVQAGTIMRTTTYIIVQFAPHREEKWTRRKSCLLYIVNTIMFCVPNTTHCRQ